MGRQLLKQAVIRKLAFMQQMAPITNVLSMKDAREHMAAMTNQAAKRGALSEAALNSGLKGMASGVGKGLLGWGGLYLGARGLQNMMHGDQRPRY
jgi:hypothetical protein